MASVETLLPGFDLKMAGARSYGLQPAQHRLCPKENPMRKQIEMTLTVIALLCGIIVTGALAQATNSSSKMTNQQMMDKMTHMSPTEKTEMFDKMTNAEKMEAMKLGGHDTSKMSEQERTETMSKLTPEQKADMFDKMPMDTKMATMRKAMNEQKTGK
jgi:hypothetical protein